MADDTAQASDCGGTVQVTAIWAARLVLHGTVRARGTFQLPDRVASDGRPPSSTVFISQCDVTGCYVTAGLQRRVR